MKAWEPLQLGVWVVTCNQLPCYWERDFHSKRWWCHSTQTLQRDYISPFIQGSDLPSMSKTHLKHTYTHTSQFHFIRYIQHWRTHNLVPYMLMYLDRMVWPQRLCTQCPGLYVDSRDGTWDETQTKSISVPVLRDCSGWFCREMAVTNWNSWAQSKYEDEH